MINISLQSGLQNDRTIVNRIKLSRLEIVRAYNDGNVQIKKVEIDRHFQIETEQSFILLLLTVYHEILTSIIKVKRLFYIKLFQTQCTIYRMSILETLFRLFMNSIALSKSSNFVTFSWLSNTNLPNIS